MRLSEFIDKNVYFPYDKNHVDEALKSIEIRADGR